MQPAKVYLAGFDVFRPDAVERGTYLKSLCETQGLIGRYPFDNEVPAGLSPADAAALICQSNIDMIKDCDVVLANLNVFRGYEPDSGTVFEVGYAIALGKPVWAYFESKGSLRDQVPHTDGVDEEGFFVEDFGLARNLMMACSWSGSSDTVEEAVIRIAEEWQKKQTVDYIYSN